jgi:peptide/nickel transport system permease protein
MSAPPSVLSAVRPSRSGRVPVTRSRGYWEQSWRRLRANRFGIAFGVVLLVLGALALGAPVLSAGLTGYQPSQQDLDHIFAGPSERHVLGTDELGRDVLTRLVWGARVSLGVGFLTVALYILIGGAVGLVAGYYGGVVDEVLMRFVDILMAIPTIFLLILLTSLLPLSIGPQGAAWMTIRHDAVSLSIVIALTVWSRPARLVRGEALSIKHRDFVLASRAVGASGMWIVFRHLLPNVLPVIIVTASLGVGQIILTEAALDFIGLGVQPPAPSWGNMLINSQRYFHQSLWLVIWPGLSIVMAVLAANIFGNAVRDAFDPRL